MATDPNFLRLSKGAYSLHCFHPDKEQLVRAAQPKKRKMTDHFAGRLVGGLWKLIWVFGADMVVGRAEVL